MKLSIIAVLTFALAVLEEASAAAGPGTRSLPKNFIKCKKSDPNLIGCVSNAVEDSFGKMKDKGIPSLGVLPLEPLVVQEINLDSGNPNAPVNLKLYFKNMKVYGVTSTYFTDYKLDLENTRIQTTSISPKIVFDADYIADGKILLLPIKGQGLANFTLDELETTTDMVFKLEEKNGETYWAIQNFGVKFRPRKVTMYFSGLLSQDKKLGDGINKVMNENWEAVFDAIRPDFEVGFGAIFKEITHRVFGKVPINRIFLD